jgi:hypothetical protein
MKVLIRTKTTLIPPNVSSLRELGKLHSKYPQAHPTLFARMKQFYRLLPKGEALPSNPTTWYGRYYQKYIETNSLTPVLHFMGIMVPVGYYLAYFKGGHYHPRYEFH